MIEIKNINPPVDEKHVVALEATMGATIPEPYRTFLLTYNGGSPKPNLVDIDGAPFKGTVLDDFFGIGTIHETSEISWNLDVSTGCLENKLLPIACDSFGNFFVMPLTDEERGSVYYFNVWSGGRPLDPPEPWFVAPDFQTLLDKIHDWSPEERAEMDAIIYERYRFVRLADWGRKLEKADTTRLEEAVGLPLPNVYKWFLLDFNGGFCSPSAIDIDGAPFGATNFELLYSFEASDETRDMLHHWKSAPHAKEKQLFPIGRDGRNGYFTLDLSAERHGQVFYLDGNEDEPQAYWVAKNFDALMDKLRKPHREELGNDVADSSSE